MTADDLPASSIDWPSATARASTSWRRCARARSTSIARARCSTTTPSCSRGGWRRSSSGTCWSARSAGIGRPGADRARASRPAQESPAEERRALARPRGQPPQPVPARLGRRSGAGDRRSHRAARASRSASGATPSGISPGTCSRRASSGTASAVVFGRTFLFHPPDARDVGARVGRARRRRAGHGAATRSCFTCRASTSAGTASVTSGAAKVYRDA